MQKITAAVFAVALALAAGAEDEPKVPADVAAAVEAYLRAPARKDLDALGKVCALVKDDVKLAAAAVRNMKPLTEGQAGTKHGLKFTSDRVEWEYSIHLPKAYDGKKRFPVLVLPDHGAIPPEDAIAFWRDKKGAEELILFRPVIVKHRDDPKLFPNTQFLTRDQWVAAVMRSALTHLRLNYAVDDDRLVMTGLSQAGFYSWYYAASFPDDFAGIVPESAGGPAVRMLVQPLASNLAGLRIRILHSEGDSICPYADATAMKGAIDAAGGAAELITYHDADYPGGKPFENRHPGPHMLRMTNVLSWLPETRRAPAAEITRLLKYSQQGREGRWRVQPPKDVSAPATAKLSDKDGVLVFSGVEFPIYLASPEDVAAGREFSFGNRKFKMKPDVRLLFEDFKALGDRGRLAAGEIDLR